VIRSLMPQVQASFACLACLVYLACLLATADLTVDNGARRQWIAVYQLVRCQLCDPQLTLARAVRNQGYLRSIQRHATHVRGWQLRNTDGPMAVRKAHALREGFEFPWCPRRCQLVRIWQRPPMLLQALLRGICLCLSRH